MRLLEYLRRAVDDGASDLFLVAGGPISYKLEGRIRPMEPEKAAKILAKPCYCGIFNITRAENLLEAEKQSV